MGYLDGITSHLADEMRGRDLLFDNSFLEPREHPDVIDTLAEGGIPALEGVDAETIKKRITRVRWIEDICGERKRFVTKEVRREFEQLLTKVNEIFVKNGYRLDGRTNSIKEKMILLHQYGLDLQNVFGVIGTHDPLRTFDKQQARVYHHLVGSADYFLSKLEAVKSPGKRPMREGLQSDRKLIAAAVALSYRHPVLVLTSSGNITKTIDTLATLNPLFKNVHVFNEYRI
jgi:hypothetical protein